MNRSLAFRSRRFSTAALLVAGVLFAAPAARAEFPFPPSPREVHHELRGLAHDVLRTLGRIPVEIHREVSAELGEFLIGSVYYGPHRHHHATYSFPVWIDGEVDYRPFVYCNSRLYGSYDARPQFWSGWGEPTQSRWCDHHHSWYPTAHACFRGHSRPQYRPSYGSNYRHDYRPQYREQYREQYRPDYRPHSGSHYGAPRDPAYRPEHRPSYRPEGRSDRRSTWRQDDRHGSRDGRRQDAYGRGQSGSSHRGDASHRRGGNGNDDRNGHNGSNDRNGGERDRH